MDNEYAKYTPVETLLSRFEDVSTKSFKRMMEGSLLIDTQILKQIQDECGRISLDKGQEELETFTLIQSLVDDSTSDEQLQSSLFDILGFDEFNLISKIVQNKQVFAEARKSGLLSAQDRAQLLIENQKRNANQQILPKSEYQKYPHVYKNQDTVNIAAITGGRFALPKGTTRNSYPLNEELIIPYPEELPNKWISKKQLVKVKDLDFCVGVLLKTMIP